MRTCIKALFLGKATKLLANLITTSQRKIDKKALPHMTEPEVHPKKYFDQIEVFGSMEKRSWIHGPKSPKRLFINEPKCPVRNPFDRIGGVVREEGI